MVGIDGCGASGKTTLGGQLAGALGAHVIHTDDFASWDNALDWQDRFLAQVIDPLSANKPARYQRYDWTLRQLAEWHDVPIGGTVLIEGVSATRTAFRPVLCYSIYVDAPRALRLQRGLARDGEDALPQWQTWMAQEDSYLVKDAPRAYADICIDGSQPII